MSNLPATVDTSKLVEGIQRTLAGRSDNTGDLFLRLSRGGDWIYGADDTTIEDGSHWMVHPASFESGYAAWGDGELLGEQMASVVGEPVLRSDLPDVGAEWRQQTAFRAACLNGEDKGMSVLYKSTAKGAQRACSDLMNSLIRQIDVDSNKIVPIIELDSGSYPHKKYGKIHYPIFNVIDWHGLDTLVAPSSVAKKVDAPKKEEEKEEEKPARRRRRRSA